MKKYIAASMLAVLGGSSVLLSSCEDTLDADKYFDDRVTLESVFTDIDQTHGWLSQSFTWLRGDLAEVCTKERTGNMGMFCFADDYYYGDRDPKYDNGYTYQETYNAFKQGDYTEDYGWNSWYNCYKGIYQASVFIHNVDRNDRLTVEERTDMKGQARFVRAYYYWLLLKRYGPVPIMPDEGVDYTLDYSQLSYPRNTYEEVAEHISSEMIQACKELSNWSRHQGNTSEENIVRPTRGAALAVRALAYIYAASPLANGQLANGEHTGVDASFANSFRNFDGTPLLSLTYDESKWARAAAACRDVMECPADYDLYHVGVYTTDNKTTGYPRTITPYDDGDFSTKGWPEGYNDIDPYISYRDLFNGAAGLMNNPEIIFSRGYNTNTGRHQSIDGMVTHQMPNTLNGWNCHGLTQKMVDAYYMLDGTDVPGKDSEWGGGDGSSRVTGWTTTRGDNAYSKYPPLGVGVSMQYANREPRFYASVAFNGSYWWNANPNVSNHYMQVFYWRGTSTNSSGSTEVTENNGYTNNAYHLRTGIGCKKFVHPSDWREQKNAEDYGHIIQKWEPAIRYADILLMYAEALNELTGGYSVPSWDGSTVYNISRDVNEMKRGIHPVRIRAGVPDYPAEDYADASALRKRIKRERMIEFLAEGKRYFDLRRWMDAAVEESTPIYGCNVLMTSKQQDDFQQVVPIYTLPTIFNVKMYFWPIRVEELKRNRNLVQSPGWKYFD